MLLQSVEKAVLHMQNKFLDWRPFFQPFNSKQLQTTKLIQKQNCLKRPVICTTQVSGSFRCTQLVRGGIQCYPNNPCEVQLILRYTWWRSKTKVLQEGGEEEKELHLGQTLSQTHPASWKQTDRQFLVISIINIIHVSAHSTITCCI